MAASIIGCKHSKETKAKIAAGLLGRKHSEESLAKMSGRKHSEETLTKIRDHLVKLNESKGIPVKVLDLETNIYTEYKSIRLAALELNASPATLGRCLKAQKLYKERYKLVQKT
jgi:group I intron endonuclease